MKQTTICLAFITVLALLQGFAAQPSLATEPSRTAAPEASGGMRLPPCDPRENPDCEPPPDKGEKCNAVTGGPPAGNGRYSCNFAITDAYGRPARNTPVHMETRWCNKQGSKVLATSDAFTDANGSLALTISSRSPNRIECSLSSAAEPLFKGPSHNIQKSNTKLPIGTTGTLTTQIQPAPDQTRQLAGLEAGAGRMDLYQSGSYDKVLLIAEQFDQNEHSEFNRDRRRFWKQLSPLLINLFGKGWDIWLMQPHDTGDSLHEQAAEFAQGVAAAAAAYPALPLCFTPTVAVMGFNTGGLVARIATARWEADAAWRAQLGLPAALPVRFVGTYDSPHYGMHLNLDMQKFVWENSGGQDIHRTTNLDSCAASQVLRGRYDPKGERKTNKDFLAFFVDGTPAHFFSKIDNTEHECAAGPAVATLNAARGVPGWPSTPVRLGFAQSDPQDTTKCFTADNENQNSSGSNLCAHVGELCAKFQCQPNGACFCAQHVSIDTTAFTPTAGQTWLRVFKDDPSLPDLCPDSFFDAEDRVEWSDIAPGSRNPLFIEGFLGSGNLGPIFCKATAHQRFPTTLIPFVSAAGLQGPGDSSPYTTVRSPFTEMNPSARSRVADVITIPDGSNLIDRMNAFAPGCTPPVINPN